MGVAVAPGDVAADQSGLLVVVGVIGAVEREVAQCLELGLDSVEPRRVVRCVGEFDVVGGCPPADALVLPIEAFLTSRDRFPVLSDRI